MAKMMIEIDTDKRSFDVSVDGARFDPQGLNVGFYKHYDGETSCHISYHTEKNKVRESTDVYFEKNSDVQAIVVSNAKTSIVDVCNGAIASVKGAMVLAQKFAKKL